MQSRPPRTRKIRVSRGRPLSKPESSDRKRSRKEPPGCAERGLKAPKEPETSLHRIVPVRARQAEKTKNSAVRI